MKSLNNINHLKISFMSLFLVFSTACVITPDGSMPPPGVEVIPPSIAIANDAFVSVRVGPGFYASDAYLLAYDHCLNRGLYAYEVSPWAPTANIIRTLGYDCRPNFIAPPIIRRVHRRNRWRHNFFQDYYRTHRPGLHYRTSSGGWWGRRNRDNQPPNRPVYNAPRRSRDGRALTPNSPWSRNPERNRYEPRRSSPRNSSPRGRSGSWWGGSNNNNTQPAVSPRPNVSTTPSKPRVGFWGKKDKEPKKSKYSSRRGEQETITERDRGQERERGSKKDYSSREQSKSRFSPISRRESASKSNGGSAKRPGWFGK